MAIARVRSEGVAAGAVSAGAVLTLVDIGRAGGAGESRRARAGVCVSRGMAGGTVAAGFGGAVVHLLTLVTPEAGWALASILVQGQELAGGAVHAGVGVAGVGHRYLAEGRLVTHGTDAVKLGTRQGHDHVAGATVLAAGARPVPTGVEVLAVLPNILVRTLAGRLGARVGDTAAAVLAGVRRTRYETIS